MARRKLNTIKFPDIEDVYYLDADKVEFDDSATYADGSVGKALVNKANIDGYYDELTAGSAAQILGSKFVEDTEPYKFRTTGGSADVGNREQVDAIVGGTIAWNQLCDGASVTVPNNHKYIMSKSGASSMGISTGSAITGLTSGTDMVHDLTQMFGSAVADYIYSLEQSSAGKGVAFFRNMFPETYYEYNAGELKSVSGLSAHVTTGKNQFDGLTLRAGDFAGGNESVRISQNLKDRVVCKAGDVLTISAQHPNIATGTLTIWCRIVNEDNQIIGGSDWDSLRLSTERHFTCSVDGYFTIIFGSIAGSITTNQITVRDVIGAEVQVEFGSTATSYEPYKKHSYPLDSSLTLRGVPKLSADNKMYYDGDTYAPDGTVTRKYGTRAYQSGDESLANAITDGTNTVYKLTDETTETADPYTKIQTCDDFGTEEYVSISIVPVGHDTKYPANLRDKLQHLPDLADNDGYYMIKQASKQMSLEPFRIPIRIPKAPSENGTYVLKATVSGGTPTYTWVEEN